MRKFWCWYWMQRSLRHMDKSTKFMDYPHLRKHHIELAKFYYKRSEA